MNQKLNGPKILSEINLDSSFPDSQFSIPGYRIIKEKGNKNGGGIWFHINEGIPFKVIECNTLPGTLEILTLEIILDKMKILLVALYKPPTLNE